MTRRRVPSVVGGDRRGRRPAVCSLSMYFSGVGVIQRPVQDTSSASFASSDLMSRALDEAVELKEIGEGDLISLRALGRGLTKGSDLVRR